MPVSVELFVGLDLGGSGTRAALAGADGAVLAVGRGPSGLVGGAGGNRQLARALDSALASITARVGHTAVEVFAGTRGLSIAGRRERLELELHTRFPQATVQVSNDAHIGLWGALAGQPGVAVIAGAGSIALARTQDGREGRAGGWGYLLGDEGSGYWIGREALITYLRMLERGTTASRLAALVTETTTKTTVVDTLGWFYRGTDQVARLAALAPLVTQAAHGGDRDAAHILEAAGAALADLASTAVRQVFAEPEEIQVVTIGGVWSAGPPLDDAFNTRLNQQLPRARRVKPRLLPVGGSLLLAMGADRRPVNSRVVERLGERLQS